MPDAHIVRLRRKVNILSLSGGGIRGYFSALILEDLEKASPFLHKVDLFAGTSTGAIIAAFLASGRAKAVSEVAELYRKNAGRIFKRNLQQKVLSVFGLYSSRYNADGLREVLTEYFGDARLGDLPKNVLIPAMDLGGDGRPYQAKFFDNFKGNSTDLDIPVVDVLLASAAAPTYFPSHKILFKMLGLRHYVDGGIFCNHPAVAAICAAIDSVGLSADLKDVQCLHVATGYYPENALGWAERGVIGWVQDAISLATEQYSTMQYQSARLLGERFRCVGTTFKEKIELDDLKAIQKIDQHYPATKAQVALAQDYLRKFWLS
jgi:patatin-like phospholipase/acyl hydrolase